jgi:hypothetical protein
MRGLDAQGHAGFQGESRQVEQGVPAFVVRRSAAGFQSIPRARRFGGPGSRMRASAQAVQGRLRGAQEIPGAGPSLRSGIEAASRDEVQARPIQDGIEMARVEEQLFRSEADMAVMGAVLLQVQAPGDSRMGSFAADHRRRGGLASRVAPGTNGLGHGESGRSPALAGLRGTKGRGLPDSGSRIGIRTGRGGPGWGRYQTGFGESYPDVPEAGIRPVDLGSRQQGLAIRFRVFGEKFEKSVVGLPARQARRNVSPENLQGRLGIRRESRGRKGAKHRAEPQNAGNGEYLGFIGRIQILPLSVSSL